jgi:hypothetical protein
LFAHLRKTIGGSTATGFKNGLCPGSAETIRQMCRELGACPICGKNFDGHAWAPFATIVLAGKNRKHIAAFFDALEERRWQELRKFQGWDARGENAEAIAIRCTSGDLAVAIVNTAVSESAFKRVERCKCVGGEDARALDALIGAGAWKALEALPAAPVTMLPT